LAAITATSTEGRRDCGAPQERPLAAVQFELDDPEGAAMELWPCQSGEIVCVANHDVDTTSCLTFLIGKVYETLFLAFGGSVNK
jgi:hypothetical protein